MSIHEIRARTCEPDRLGSPLCGQHDPMPWILAGLLAIIAVAAILLLAQWGLVIAVIAAVVGGLYVMLARRKDPSVGTVESGRPTEPTGMPRKATGGAETANERVGQS